MTRDITVIVSIALFAIAWVLGRFLDMPSHIKPEDPVSFKILFVVMFCCAIRASVLWFQTLINATRGAKVGWVIGHVVLGPIASYIYYFTTIENASKKHNKGVVHTR
jgi:drug/metabolite transporter (DMT)-like permease